MTNITGKDKTAEETIEYFSKTLAELGLELEFTQILNPVPNLYSVILQDKNIPYIQTNGKGTTLEAAKASAYGEMAERYLNQSFFEDFYLGKDISEGEVVRYPDEVWVPYHENIAQLYTLLRQAKNLEFDNKLNQDSDEYDDDDDEYEYDDNDEYEYDDNDEYEYDDNDEYEYDDNDEYEYDDNNENKFDNECKNKKDCNFSANDIKELFETKLSKSEIASFMEHLPDPREMTIPDYFKNASFNLPPYNRLFDKEIKNIIDQFLTLGFPLTDMVSASPERGMCCLNMKCETNPKKSALFPIRLLEITHLSNGLCAGNTEYEAKVQGISEIFERYIRRIIYFGQNSFSDAYFKEVKNTTLSSEINKPYFPQYDIKAIIKDYPTCGKIITDLDALGFSVTCYDMSLEGLMPVVGSLIKKKGTNLYKLSIASHPVCEIALERTLTECFQGVELNNLDFAELDVDNLISQILNSDDNKIPPEKQKFNNDVFEVTQDKRKLINFEYVITSDTVLNNLGIDALSTLSTSHDLYPANFKRLTSFAKEDLLENSYVTSLFKKKVYIPGNFLENYSVGGGIIDEDFFYKKPIYKLTNWGLDKNSTTKDQFNYLLKLIKNLKLKLYSYDASYKDIKAYRLVIPGLSEIIPPELSELHDNLYDVSVAKDLTKLPTFSNEDYLKFCHKLFASPSSLSYPISSMLGLFSSESNPYNKMEVGDFLNLATTYPNPKKNLISFTVNSQSLPMSDAPLSKYIKTILNIRKTALFTKKAYKTALKAIQDSTNDETFKLCSDLALNGAPYTFFPDLGENFENYTPQRKLVELYKIMLQKRMEK